MKALMNIFNSDPPVLNKYETWSSEFRSFVTDCLIKDPVQRVSAAEILHKHRKFFSKAKDNVYIQ
jgi:serine/threonine protein kinase